MAIVGGLGSPEVPEWAPLREDVADYVPHRTLARAESTIVGSEDVFYLTFDSDTRPSGIQTDRLIGKAVALVASRLSPFNPVSEPAAAAVVCLQVAAWIERGWPEDQYALERANDLEKRADLALAALVESNTAANHDADGDGDDDRIEVAPVFSFPPADPRYDSARYW